MVSLNVGGHLSVSVQVLSKHTLRLSNVTSRTKPCKNMQFLPRDAYLEVAAVSYSVSRLLSEPRGSTGGPGSSPGTSQTRVSQPRATGGPQRMGVRMPGDKNTRHLPPVALASFWCTVSTSPSRRAMNLTVPRPVTRTDGKATVGRAAVLTPGCTARK